VRINNDDVLQNLEGVVESIVAQCLHTIQKTPPLAPPRSTGEGD
jgi:very-short-patch-repair endonuclease